MTAAVMPYAEVASRFDPVLGLEVHVELGTETKMFCSCSAKFGGEPNTHTCPVCLGLPGALPVLNDRAVEFTVLIGLALHCQIAERCRFARKNYFYPDMPKNFQTSQYDEPLCFDGYLDVEVDGKTVRVEIERVHMEEDTGKSLHVGGATGRIHGATHSLLDFNRAGVPLVEIVTKTVPGTGALAPEVARAYVTELRDVLRGLGVSDVRMEQGSLRCDANISLRDSPTSELGTRTETKNVNSLRSVERAVRYEMTRQAAVLASGGTVKQETRHFDEATGTTNPGRSKEEAADYRYFPEPDLVPITHAPAAVDALRGTLPPPPSERRRALAAEHGWSALDLQQMQDAEALDLVVDTIAAGASASEARAVWMNTLSALANDASVSLDALPVSIAQVVGTLALVRDGRLSATASRQVYGALVAGTHASPAEAMTALGLEQQNDTGALTTWVDEAIAAQPGTAEKVRGGKVQAVGALVGAVMKSSRGTANPGAVRTLVLERLGVTE